MHGEHATARTYDDQMAERLLGIAADVLRSFGSAFGGQHLAIIGGAVPGLLVPQDTTRISRRVETGQGMLTFEFPVAGLTSWLCLKSDAIMRRNKPKDAYDVVWVVDALGPEVVAERIATSPLLSGGLAADVHHQLSMLVTDQFKDIDSVGPRSYASFRSEDARTPDDRSLEPSRHIALGGVHPND